MPLGGFRKHVLIVLIASQLFLAARPAHAEPNDALLAAANPTQGSYWDTITQQTISLFESGVGDKVLIGALGFILAAQITKTTAAMFEISAARQLRAETFEKLRRMNAEYELHREMYIKFPQTIKNLESENEGLRAQLKEAEASGDFAAVEIHRRKIERNQASIDAKRLKVPVILMNEAVRGVVDAEKALDAHIQALKKAATPAPARLGRNLAPAAKGRNGKKNGNGSANGNGHASNGHSAPLAGQPPSSASRAAERWEQTQRVDYIAEWLESPDGKSFSNGAGKTWAETYQSLAKGLNGSTERLATIYNGMVDDYNRHMLPEQTLPRLELQRSAHGPNSRYFSLEPENPYDAAVEIGRADIATQLADVCEKKLSYLAKNVAGLKNQAKFRNAFAKQIIHPLALAGTSGTLLGVYTLYQIKQGKSYQEVQKEAATENKIREQTDINLAAQIEKEKRGENRLRPFLRATVSSFLSHQGELEAGIVGGFDMRDRQAGKPGLLNARQEEHKQLGADAERDRASQAFERATWEFYTRLNITSLEQLRKAVYTDDAGNRDTILRRDLTVIYRDALQTLYPSIIDSDALNQLEPTVIRKMVDQTLKDLADHVEDLKKKGADAIPASAPVPGTASAAALSHTESKPSSIGMEQLAGEPGIGISGASATLP